MFDAIKTWLSGREATEENKWDATNVQMQQPNSPAGMNETVTQQPVSLSHHSMELKSIWKIQHANIENADPRVNGRAHAWWW